MLINVIQYLLTSVIIVAIINVILIYKLNANTVFSYVLLSFNGYLFVHSLFILLIEQFYGHKVWLDHYAPFSLMYGPFLYFVFAASSNSKISVKKIILHTLPFVLFVIGFLYIMLAEPNSFMFMFNKALNLSIVISFSVYTLLVMFLNTEPLSEQFKQRKLIVLGGVIMLLFVSIIAIVALTSVNQIITKPNAILLLRIMIYSCMFLSVIMVFKYKISIIFMKLENVDELIKVERVILKPSFTQVAKYEKSTLSSSQLEEYGKKLEKLMFSQRVYLSTDLSLHKLAQFLRIPNHHLTQVLSLKIKMSFYDYVNGFRVQYACIILENEPNANLENVAERSGFNSKVSFNRHFKSILGCTPSNYRSQTKDFKDLA